MYVPVAVVHQTDIKAGVAEVEQALLPDVVRINYEVGTDWSGDWAIFFRILLSDDAGARRLMDTANTVIGQLGQRFDFATMGLFPYHNFRTVSEQAVLREKAWA